MTPVYEGAIQDLIDEFDELPGVGPKSAQRMAFHILAADATRVERFGRRATLTSAMRPCLQLPTSTSTCPRIVSTQIRPSLLRTHHVFWTFLMIQSTWQQMNMHSRRRGVRICSLRVSVRTGLLCDQPLPTMGPGVFSSVSMRWRHGYGALPMGSLSHFQRRCSISRRQ